MDLLQINPCGDWTDSYYIMLHKHKVLANAHKKKERSLIAVCILPDIPDCVLLEEARGRWRVEEKSVMSLFFSKYIVNF